MMHHILNQCKVYGLALIALAVIGQSCKKSDLQEETAPVYTAQQIEDLRAFVATTTGHALDKVSYSQGSYKIDGDGLITIKDADERYRESLKEAPTGQAKTSQRVYTYTIAPTKTAVELYADATVSADWLAALDQAIANWNSVNSTIVMKRVTATTTTTTTSGNGKGKKKTTTTTSSTPPAYDILVTTMYDNATSTVAMAYYPDYMGNPGKSITINTHYNSLSPSYKIFALTHEIGHNCGFTHTDGSFGSLVAGTPEVDPNSVMNSFVLPWSGFTSYDLLAIRTVYYR